MRWLLLLATFGSLGYGAWWINSTHPEVKTKVEKMVNVGTFHTLEVRYSANQIMETHRKELLKDNRHKYLDPELKFYPYLLLEVKYSVSPDKTAESVILWDLCDGEMVLETKAWQKTHGFGDCILANTDRHEFKVINALAKKGGACDRETLAKILHVENDLLDAWVDNLRRKKILVQAGNKYRLHLQDPRLKTVPETRLEERLVTQPRYNAVRVSKRFSLSQIERIARAAFGSEFAIRHTNDVYLPVHCIVVQNPDGSIHKSHWNALNGKRIIYSHSLE